MIKKISAVVLALVLCLSVVVVPASALDLADGKDMAFELKWDKEYYNPGDTATLSVYMKVTDDMQLGTGSFVIGLNSAQITQTDNPVEDLKANAVASDLWNSFWKDPSQLTISWLASTIADKVEVANTEAEKGLYDQYMKIVINRNTADGSHENATTLKYGLPGSDINAIEEPIITFSYVVSASAEIGTSLVAGITSGSTSCSPAQTAFKYIKAPGASTTANVAASAFDCSAAAAEATVGTAIPEFTINQGKDAIRFNKNADNSYKNISIRTTAEIAVADLQGACDGKTANEDVADYITEAGFVYIPTTYEFSVDAAKAAIDAIKDDEGTSNGYTKKKVSYIQNTGTTYKYICVVDVEDEAIASAAYNTFAYICLDFDGDGTADKTYYYEAANSVSAKTLYNAKYEQANSTYSTYGWTLAAK